MARQIIDTAPPSGDPAPTAFSKVNANFAEIYGWASGGTLAPTTNPVFNGENRTNGRLFVVPPVAGSDQVVIRESGSGVGTIIDAVNNGNSAFRPVTIRGSAVDVVTPLTAHGGLVVATTIVSRTNELAMGSANGMTGSVVLRPNGVSSVAGEARLTTDGTLTVVSLTQTSSADVKDIHGAFDEDACALLDRLVVINHEYLPEFVDDGGKVHRSLLAENVRDVMEWATGGGHTITVQEPYEVEEPVDVEVPDENGETKLARLLRNVTKYRAVDRYVPLNVDVMAIVATTVRAHQQKSYKLRQHENRIEAVTDQAELLAQRLTALEIVTARLDELAERLAAMQDLAQRVDALEAAA